MGFNLPSCPFGGKGSVVKHPWRNKGLRNKRSAHRARLKRQEELKKLQRQREQEYQDRANSYYDNPYEHFGYNDAQ